MPNPENTTKKFEDLEKQYCYVVEDLKAEEGGLPFWAYNDTLAKRQILFSIQQEKTPLSMFPDDFVLWCIGCYTKEDINLWVDTGEKLDKRVVCTIGALIEEGHAARLDAKVAGGVE